MAEFDTKEAKGKWTKGPWTLKYTGGETQLVMGDLGCQMCDMTYYPWTPENPDDWVLISAAPDLYDALYRLRVEMTDTEASLRPFVDDALKKALGVLSD